MPRSDKYCYVSVRLPKGEALARVQQEATYYGKTEGELLADVALAWTKMLKGEWNFHWPLALPMPALQAGQANGNTLPVAAPETTSTAQREAEERAKREEAERKAAERREARLAAARAEFLDA